MAAIALSSEIRVCSYVDESHITKKTSKSYTLSKKKIGITNNNTHLRKYDLLDLLLARRRVCGIESLPIINRFEEMMADDDSHTKTMFFVFQSLSFVWYRPILYPTICLEVKNF